MASGIKDTLEFIAGEQAAVIAIDAYMDNVPLDQALKEVFDEKGNDDEIIVFTDLKAGSVNQGFVKYISQPHVQLITGMNLPLILSVVLSPVNHYLDEQVIQQFINEAQQEIVYMNTELQKVTDDDDDE